MKLITTVINLGRSKVNIETSRLVQLLVMWLVNAKTYKLEAVFGRFTPEYAILSHTWSERSEEEITFQEITDPDARRKQGYDKIKGACQQALKDGLLHVWIDTCCIDKSSSAELSEAINSMYRWYKDAAVCYAYLADVSGSCPLLNDEPDFIGDPEILDSELDAGLSWLSSFTGSKWFKRGWTLQELIAPRKLSFYGKDWNFIGSKASLVRTISKITRIDQAILEGYRSLSSISLAKRMSWASDRTTSRLEDEAYSLLGIFSVNMPMLYGEGERAFTRLQEEIIKTSTDHSVFVWESWSGCKDTSILASSPLDFRNGYKIVHLDEAECGESYEMTNKGLRIKLPVLEHEPKDPRSSISLAVLNCRFEDNFTGPIAIQLLSAESPLGRRRKNEFSIWPVQKPDEIVSTRFSIIDLADLSLAKEHTLTILRRYQGYKINYNPTPKCWLRITDNETGPDFDVIEVFPRDNWNMGTGVVLVAPNTPGQGAALLSDRSGRKVIVAFGYSVEGLFWDPNFKPKIGIFPFENDVTLKKACDYCTVKSESATLRLSKFEEARVAIECKEIMNETLFVVRVSLVRID